MNNEDRKFGADGATGGMHGPRRLLGPDGQPLPPRADLTEEIALPQLIGARALWDESVATGLTPPGLAKVLRECVRGDIRAYLTLAEELEERDLHYQGVLGVRKRAIAGIKPSINAVSAKRVDKKVAQFVADLIEAPEITDLIEDMMDAVGKGFSAIEIIWGEKKGQWLPLSYAHRDPRYFTFDYISRTDLRLSELGELDGLELPPAKFIRHMPRMKTGIPIRAGLARTVAWGFLFKSFSLKNWAAFLDVYGQPLRLGKYHPSATAAERSALLRAVVGIASDAAAIIPESMLVEFIEAKEYGGRAYEAMCRFVDEQVSKIVLGQTMSTDNGSSKSQATVHNEIRIDIVEWDGRQIAKTLNRDLIAWAVAFNFGADVEAPLVEFPMPKREDVAVKSAALGLLVPLGLEVAQDDVRESLGYPAPQAGAKLLGARAPGPDATPGERPRENREIKDERQTPPAKPEKSNPGPALNAAHSAGGCQCAGCLALNGQHPVQADAVDQIGLDEAADWSRQVSPMIDAILAAAEKTESYEAFAAELDRLAGALDTDPLAKRLADAMMKARGLGDATDHV